MRASDGVFPVCCKGVWWVRSSTALALMLSAVGLAILGRIDSATAQALHTQVANSLRVEWQRTTSLVGRPAIEGRLQRLPISNWRCATARRDS